MNRLNRYALSILALSVMLAIIAGVNATPTQASGSAPVTVVNTPLPVTVSGDAPLHPFQALLCSPGCQGGGTTDPTTSVHVPPDARLVIEYISGYCGQLVDYVAVETVVNGAEILHTPGPPEQHRAGGPFVFAQTVRIYADPDTVIRTFNSAPGAAASCNLQLSGHTVVP